MADFIKANIIEGIYFQVGGEAGRTNGLSWSIMEDMGYHFQQLIKLLAKYNLAGESSPILKGFDIEIFDFQRSSAVPAFRLKPVGPDLFKIVEGQQLQVAEQIDNLMSIADRGHYEDFFGSFDLLEVKEDLADEMYKFRTSVGSSSLKVVTPLLRDKMSPVYDIKSFTKDQIEKLLPAKRKNTAQTETKEMLGLIRQVGRRNKIIDLYEGKNTAVSFAPTSIVTLDKVYHLQSALLCQVFKEEDHWVIQHEMLDIYATGTTIDDAEFDFYNEFDAAYKFYESTEDDKLSDRLLAAKGIMKSYIKTISDN